LPNHSSIQRVTENILLAEDENRIQEDIFMSDVDSENNAGVRFDGMQLMAPLASHKGLSHESNYLVPGVRIAGGRPVGRLLRPSLCRRWPVRGCGTHRYVLESRQCLAEIMQNKTHQGQGAGECG
jgi:hypothetical protein